MGPPFFGTDPSISAGEVAFRATDFESPGVPIVSGVYVVDTAGPLTVVADTNTTIPGGSGNFGFFGEPSISEGNVAFLGAETPDPFVSERGIYADLGGGLLEVIAEGDILDGETVGGDFFGVPGGLFFGNQGLSGRQLVFGAFFEDGSSGIYVATITTEVEVGIDIKPSNDLNPVNPKSRGVIPVAILGSDTFDVEDVDVSTLAFGPGGAPLAHRNGPHRKDANHDGIKDLLGHFRTEDSGIAAGDTEACVTGELLDGTPFEGCDSIVTLPPGCGDGFEMALLLPAVIWFHRRRKLAVG